MVDFTVPRAEGLRKTADSRTRVCGREWKTVHVYSKRQLESAAADAAYLNRNEYTSAFLIVKRS